MTNKSRFIIACAVTAILFFPFSVRAAAPLTLEDSIAIALKNSRVLNIAKEGAKGARAKKLEAMTGFLPKFKTSYSYTRLNEEPGFYFPGSTGAISMPASYMVAGTINNHNWIIEASQPVFAGGEFWPIIRRIRLVKISP